MARCFRPLKSIFALILVLQYTSRMSRKQLPEIGKNRLISAGLTCANDDNNCFQFCCFRFPTLPFLRHSCFLLLIYAIFGAMILLYFEVPFSYHAKVNELQDKAQCISINIEQYFDDRRWNDQNDSEWSSLNLTVNRRRSKVKMDLLWAAHQITRRCVLSEQKLDQRSLWNLKNAFLFSFGIITSLGYGKIEPQTENGRIFTVIYGFVGVPFTVILLTNFMRYLIHLDSAIRKRHLIRQQRRMQLKKEREEAEQQFKGISIADQKMDSSSRHLLLSPARKQAKKDKKLHASKKIGKKSDLASIVASLEESGQISIGTLICIVFIYMVCGGVLKWVMSTPTSQLNADSVTRFLNGVYYAFIALIHIEYGNLVPDSNWWLPLVISYVCLGLSISAIALRVGSAYVKRLYYYGRKISNIASVKIRFGAKNLQVRELLTALGNNIGLEPTILFDLDLEKLVADAIDVKEGRIERVSQTFMIVDGIWPPELVPLFIKDGGNFPLYVDAEEAQLAERGGLGKLWNSFRNSTPNRRRHSSASFLPRDLRRQNLSFIRSNTNNNDQLKNNSQHRTNVVIRRVGLRPLSDVYYDTDTSKLTKNPTINSLPSSRSQSPHEERRAPPPFLFHKPSVRFHDIIYDDWAEAEKSPCHRWIRCVNSYSFHQQRRSYDNAAEKPTKPIISSQISPIHTSLIHSTKSRSKVVENESCNMKFFVPSTVTNVHADLLSKSEKGKYMETEFRITETYCNRNTQSQQFVNDMVIRSPSSQSLDEDKVLTKTMEIHRVQLP